MLSFPRLTQVPLLHISRTAGSQGALQSSAENNALAGQATARECPHCGHAFVCDDDRTVSVPFRPWHVRGRSAVKSYVESLGSETREWLLALFVDANLQLLAVETIARGGLSECPINLGRILIRGHTLSASAFILVHNHPSGDATPSAADIRATRHIAYIARELDIPLLDHLIVAGSEMSSVGFW